MCLIVFLSELIKLCQLVRHGRLLKANSVPTKGLCRPCCLATPRPGYLSRHQQGLNACRGALMICNCSEKLVILSFLIISALGNKEKGGFSFFFSFVLFVSLKLLFFPFSLILLYSYCTCHSSGILWMLFQDWLIYFFCLWMYAVYKFNVHPIKIP